MVQPTLAVELRGTSGNPKVFRVLGESLLQLGNDVVGSTFEGTGSRSSNPMARVIQFAGKVFVWQNNKILRFNSGTRDWDVVRTLASSPLVASGASHTGLWNVLVNGVPFLVGVYFYNNGGTITPVAVKFDGTTWFEQVLVGNGTGGACARGIAHRNVLYFITDTNFAVAYDPSIDALTFMTLGGYGTTTAADFCEYNGQLYTLRSNSSASDAHKILQLVGASWVSKLSLSSSTGSGGNPETTGAYCLFTDGSHLYALLYQDDGAQNGVRCFQIDPAGAGLVLTSEITNTVVPTDIRWPSASGLALGSIGTRIHCFVDQETVPTAVTINIWLASDHNTPYTYYQWVSNAALMTESLSFGSAQIALPNTKYGAGDRVFTDGEMDVLITGTTAQLNGELLKLKAWGDPGQANKFVRFYFNTLDQPALQQCTLVGLASGGSAVRNGNQLEQVDANNGSTEYSVVWDMTADGVAIGTPVGVTPRLSTS